MSQNACCLCGISAAEMRHLVAENKHLQTDLNDAREEIKRLNAANEALHLVLVNASSAELADMREANAM